MNLVVLVGRLTKDPEVKNTSTGKTFCNFTIAVQRTYKNAEGGYDADFVNCVCWGNTANFISQHFAKGKKIGVKGTIQTRTFDDTNGQRRYVTEVNVDNAEFIDSANQGDNTAPAPAPNPAPVKTAPSIPTLAPDLPEELPDLPFSF